MISSLEVGSTFRILDEASPALAKIAGSLKELQGAIDKTKESFTALAKSSFAGLTGRIDALAGSLGKVEGSSAAIGGNLDKAMASAAGSIDAVGNSIGGLAAKIGALNAELAATGKAATSAEGEAAGAPSLLRRRGTGGGGHGPFGMPGPGGLAVMAGAAAVGWGIDDEMKVEDQAAQALYISQDKKAKADAAASIQQYRDIALNAAVKGSANPLDVAIAMHRASNLLSGQMDYAKMMKLEEQVLPYAIGEARAKGEAYPVVPGSSICSGCTGLMGWFGSAPSAGGAPSCRIPVAVLRRRGLRLIVWTPFRGLSRLTMSQ